MLSGENGSVRKTTSMPGDVVAVGRVGAAGADVPRRGTGRRAAARRDRRHAGHPAEPSRPLEERLTGRPTRVGPIGAACPGAARSSGPRRRSATAASRWLNCSMRRWPVLAIGSRSSGCATGSTVGLSSPTGKYLLDHPRARRRSAGRGAGRRAGCSSRSVRAPMTASGVSASRLTVRIRAGPADHQVGHGQPEPGGGRSGPGSPARGRGPPRGGACGTARRPPRGASSSSTGASVSAAARAIARLSAIAGPVYWILANVEK